MSSEPSNPSKLNSWEDAFQYPIPTVRKLEQQLRNHADENREQLRTLVGVSYRDLLGTAERIIDMDAEIQKVEVILGQTGKKCNANSVNRMSKSFGKLQRDRSNRSAEHNSLVSHLAILECCPTVIARTLKQRGSLLLAAKLLLLSRLTHKTLSQHREAPPLVDKLRDHLASLRRKLLRAVDARFSDPERDISKLVDDMCAFSLATSSTPTDVLRHFHHIRLQTIRWHLEQISDIRSHAVKAMRLLLGTLHSTHLIFPKRLSDSLVRLKDTPLIQQFDVQSVSELNLRIHSRWLANELQSYTPWPRHDELQKSGADKILKTWANAAQTALIKGLKIAFAQQSHLDELLNIRKEIFEALPWADNRLPGLNSVDLIDKLRNAFNDRLSKIITSRVAGLKSVCKSTRMVIEEMDGPSPPLELWHSSIVDKEFSDGAEEFKALISHRYHGINSHTSKVLAVYDQWVEGINMIEQHLKGMRDTRWDGGLAEDLDDLDSRQTLLSGDDPQHLKDSLKSVLDAEAEGLLNDFTNLSLDEVPAAQKRHKATVLLRVLREISKRAALQDRAVSAVVLPVTTSAKIVTPLHSSIALAAVAAADNELSNSFSKLGKAKTVAAKPLWEGSPPRPIQPSVMAFKFLRALTAGMKNVGSDLWSRGATAVVKAAAMEVVIAHVTKFFSGPSSDSSTITNGEYGHPNNQDDDSKIEPDTETADTSNNGSPEPEHTPMTNGKSPHISPDSATSKQVAKDKLIQLTFDLYYFQAALLLESQTQSTADDTLDHLAKVVSQAAGLEPSELTRLQKSAGDYWKRTYLLFALLSR